MECIMALARILNDNEFGDVVVRKHVAQVFLFFLPGLASGFKQIALEEERVGHKIPQVIIIISFSKILPVLRFSRVSKIEDTLKITKVIMEKRLHNNTL